MRSTVIFVALLAATCASAASFDVPKRKSGLWEMKTSLSQMPGPQMVHQECVDRNTDDPVKRSQEHFKEYSQGQKPSCSKMEARREGANTIYDSVCKMGETTVTGRAVYSGSYDSAYKVDVKNTYDPPLYGGMRESTTKMEAKWLGPCKPGQKPGDITMESMPGMPNMEELMKKKR